MVRAPKLVEELDPQGREPEEDLIPDGGEYDGPSEEEEAAMVAADKSVVTSEPKTGIALFKQQLDNPDFQQAVADNLGSMTTMDPNQICRVAYQALRGNSALQECTVPSVLMGVLEATSLQLTISSILGQCYLVPFNNRDKGVKEAQFMLGFKGKMELARRGGVTQISATCVYENDQFSYEVGTSPSIAHRPHEGDDRGALKYVYAVARIKECPDPTFVVLTKQDVMKRKAASRGSENKSSPWKQWEDEMWKKSAIHALTKNLPSNIEVSEAFGRDEARDMGRMQGYKQVGPIERDPSEDPLNRIAGEG